MSSDKKNIVIVGAGLAGTAIASALSVKLDPSQYHIVLVNPRPFAIALPISLRFVVSEADDFQNTALVPLDRLFTKHNNGENKVGIVTSIVPRDARSGGHVVLESGERIPYEILVIASGSTWRAPVDFPLQGTDVVSYIHTWRNNFANAKHVVIVGGGAVGIELAGELKDEYPDKKVTIVQGDSQLMNSTYPSSFREGLAKRLVARGVSLLFNERVDSIPKQGTVGLVTRKGTEIPDADLVISARGPSPNTSFVGSLGSSTLSPSGYIKVGPTLQLVGYPRIFAAGDVIDWLEQKQAGKVGAHTKVVTKNILNMLADENDHTLVHYRGSPEAIIITNGKNGGMTYLPFLFGIVLGDFGTRWFKRIISLILPPLRSRLGY